MKTDLISEMAINKRIQTYHMGRCIVPCQGILAHKESKNKYVDFTVDSLVIITVEVSKNKLGASRFLGNCGNENHKNKDT